VGSSEISKNVYKRQDVRLLQVSIHCTFSALRMPNIN